MEQERLYTLGDLVDDLVEHSIDSWRAKEARSMTMRAAFEKHVRATELSVRSTLGGVTWITVAIECRTRAKTAEYTYLAHKRPGGLYELDARSIQ
jgi:hypothetical protein